jgi:hypothetical protein
VEAMRRGDIILPVVCLGEAYVTWESYGCGALGRNPERVLERVKIGAPGRSLYTRAQ